MRVREPARPTRLGVLDRGVENLAPALLLCRVSSVLRLPIVALLHPLSARLMVLMVVWPSELLLRIARPVAMPVRNVMSE